MSEPLNFPENFLWGAATAAHQVEGNNVHNDWWAFEQEEGNIAGNERSLEAVKHYELYEQDFRLAQEMNHNAHRFSIEWSRIQPQEKTWDIQETEHYRNVLLSLKEKNITPMVTLHHFTNPVWFTEKGGWEKEENIKYFLEFVEYIVEQYKDLVTFWITINEPNVYGFQSFDEGIWPPKKKDRNIAIQVIVNMLKAHAAAYRIIHRIQHDRQPMVSIAHHFTLLDPKNIINPLDYVLGNIQEQLFNYKPIEFLLTGRMKINVPGLKKLNLICDEVRNTLDFIGVNYYTRWLVSIRDISKRETRKGAVVNDLNWEIYPHGLFRVLMNLKKYNLPIYITENGTADENDGLRVSSLIEHLKKVHDAIHSGVDIRGYFHWSLMDNFEWAEGYKARFGLLKVDYNSPEKTRAMTESAKVFAEIAGNNLVSFALLKNDT